MKLSKRLLICLGISIPILVFKILSMACGPWPAPPDEYRITFFQPEIGDKNVEFTPYYFSLSYDYRISKTHYEASRLELKQNYHEWINATEGNFNSVDFSKVVNEYSYEVIKDSMNELDKSNSFIRCLNKKKEFKEYFILAKATESFNSIAGANDRWGINDTIKARPVYLINNIHLLLKNSTNKFIKERCAYLLCRLYFYLKDKDNLNKVYANYIQQSGSNSWVKYAAKYFVIRLKDVDHKQEYINGLLDVAEHSMDKRMIAIKLLNEEDTKSIDSFIKTDHQRAVYKAIQTLKYPAYSLKSIKEIYTLDSHNKFLNLLIVREINKLEDWLLTSISTEYQTSACKDEFEWEVEDKNYFRNQNRKNDLKYAGEFKNFLESLVAKADIDKVLLNSYLSHLNMVMGNNEDAISNCNYVLSHSSERAPEYLQAKVNSVVAGINKAKKLSPNLQEGLYKVMVTLDKLGVKKFNQNPSDFIDEVDYNTPSVKDNVLVYLGRRLYKYGDVAHAALLLNNPTKPWGEYRPGGYKDAYIFLYENAKPMDYDSLISFINNPHKTRFEKYCIRMNRQFISNRWKSYDRDLFGNTNVMYDLKGTYYLNIDSLPLALDAYKKVSKNYWKDSSTASGYYMTGDPFNLSIYDTHDVAIDSGFKNNADKAIFLSRLISLKRKTLLEKNPEKKAALFYQIGNAYFSLTYYGKYWILSKPWWSMDDKESFDKRTTFDYNYFGTVRAKEYYNKAFQYAQNKKMAAFYGVYISECENYKRQYLFYSNPKNKNVDYDHRYEWDDMILENTLKNKLGNVGFYKRLIEECPLYQEFLNKKKV